MDCVINAPGSRRRPPSGPPASGASACGLSCGPQRPAAQDADAGRSERANPVLLLPLISTLFSPPPPTNALFSSPLISFISFSSFAHSRPVPLLRCAIPAPLFVSDFTKPFSVNPALLLLFHHLFFTFSLLSSLRGHYPAPSSLPTLSSPAFICHRLSPVAIALLYLQPSPNSSTLPVSPPINHVTSFNARSVIHQVQTLT